jgi:hypothetical protein
MKKHALIIGIDKYDPKTGLRELDYSTADARRLKDALEEVCGFGPVRILEDEEATFRTIVQTLRSFRNERRIGPDDLFLFAFFGHGAVVKDQVIIPFGADAGLRTSLIHLDDLASDLCALRPRNLIILIDACRNDISDAATHRPAMAARDVELRLGDAPALNGLVIYSCAEGERTYESEEYGHGVFTKHLIDGIENQTGDARRGISGWRNGSLDCEYLAEQARKAVVAEKGSRQNPVIERAREPIILARQGEDHDGDWDEGRVHHPDRDQAPPPPTHRWERTLALFAAALALFVVAGGAIMAPSRGARPPEVVAPCPAGMPPAMNLVLMHMPPRLSDSAQGRLLTDLENTALRTVENGLLELRFADGVSPGGQILFSRCRPKSTIGIRTDSANDPYSAWLATFKTAIRDGLAAATKPSVPPPSLMATIKQIVEQRAWAGRGHNVDLIIASNLVENSEAYSQRSGDLSFERFKSMPAYSKSRTDLLQATVSLYYLRDETNVDLEIGNHVKFWSDWFGHSNAGHLRLETIEAAGK